MLRHPDTSSLQSQRQASQTLEIFCESDLQSDNVNGSLNRDDFQLNDIARGLMFLIIKE